MHWSARARMPLGSQGADGRQSRVRVVRTLRNDLRGIADRVACPSLPADRVCAPAKYGRYLSNDKLNDQVAKAVRRYQDKWADAVSNETMERGDDSLPPSPVRAKYGKGSNWRKEQARA